MNIHLTGGRPAYLGCYLSAQPLFCQCPKLRVHPAPGAHISTTRCTVFGGVHPVCARFLSHLLLLYVGKVHEAIYGCTVLWEVQPASAQNKSLILDTVCVTRVTSSLPGFSHRAREHSSSKRQHCGPRGRHESPPTCT